MGQSVKEAVSTRAGLNPESEVIDLYQQNAAELFRFAEALVRDREMAQDALQEVFLRYFVARSSGQEIQNGKSWLYRVLRNSYWIALRKPPSRTRQVSKKRKPFPTSVTRSTSIFGHSRGNKYWRSWPHAS